MSRGRPLCPLPQNSTCYSDGPLPYPRFPCLCRNAMRWLLWGAYVNWREAPVSDFSATSLPKNVDNYICSLPFRAHASIHHPSSSVQTSTESSGSSGSAYDKALRLLWYICTPTTRFVTDRSHNESLCQGNMTGFNRAVTQTLRVVSARRNASASMHTNDPVKV